MSQANPVQQAIETKLHAELQPSLLEVVNESHMHSVPPNSETHFKVVVVSDLFSGKRSVARHQMIYKTLSEEVAGPVHALAIHTYTSEEWQQSGAASPASPKCLGGSKADQH
ncbi:BolA family protein [Ketobacter sp.]|uniref:BolA family protein n=1 Tax=Ketobacter sp. TaxID=2083498 RepID=UPI000F1F6DBA|nr:BolA/IbaG family iron-sulfur metabolism protein [Ketobacter sp.]RLT97336.1 MAG: BolA/IbaG family iron-sulfur metabolism protein [Ketobacter sp.]